MTEDERTQADWLARAMALVLEYRATSPGDRLDEVWAELHAHLPAKPETSSVPTSAPCFICGGVGRHERYCERLFETAPATEVAAIALDRLLAQRANEALEQAAKLCDTRRLHMIPTANSTWFYGYIAACGELRDAIRALKEE